jgi:aryl-alcohol dehydrogenase-like predicted oxidoreductase
LRAQPVASAVIGIRTMEQLQKVSASGMTELSIDATDQLNNLLPLNYYDQHR